MLEAVWRGKEDAGIGEGQRLLQLYPHCFMPWGERSQANTGSKYGEIGCGTWKFVMSFSLLAVFRPSLVEAYLFIYFLFISNLSDPHTVPWSLICPAALVPCATDHFGSTGPNQPVPSLVKQVHWLCTWVSQSCQLAVKVSKFLFFIWIFFSQ